MKTFTITQGSAVYPHPPEDYLLSSLDPPIFVLADGVTRPDNTDGTYPDPSGAAAVARIFCESSLEESRKNFSTLTADAVFSILKKANQAIGAYNQTYPDKSLFRVTGALAILKGNEVYWGSICDSYVIRVGAQNNISYISVPCSPIQAVADGKEGSLTSFHFGCFTLQKGENLLLISDGFEPYLKLPEFISLLKKGSPNLEEEVEIFTENKILEDKNLYGHERSLIFVSL